MLEKKFSGTKFCLVSLCGHGPLYTVVHGVGEGGNISLHQQEGKFSRGENYREDRVGRQVEENVL